MKRLLILLAAFLPNCATSLLAQLGEPRNSIAVGVSAGVAMNRIGFDPTIKQKLHVGPSISIAARFTSERYFNTLCTLQVELGFQQLGWRENVLDSNSEPLPDTYSHHQNYLQLPMLARLAWGREAGGLMAYFLAGPQVGFMLGEKAVIGSTWTTDANGNPDRPNGMYAQYSISADHRFDYGITAGLGLELHTAAGRFSVEGRYYYGLSDIYKNGKKDIFSRSNNGTIVARLSYFFDIKPENTRNDERY